MTILKGKPKSRLREIRVSPPDKIGKCLVEFIHSGSVLHAERFDPFNAKESGQAINRYLNIAGQKLEASTIDSIRVQIQQSLRSEAPQRQHKPTSLTELTIQFPKLRPQLIHGILRSGETMNVIASPKVGKSFLAGNLAWCVATGRHWLSHQVEHGKVLIIDNELHPNTLAYRLNTIAEAMTIPHSERENIDLLPLRGQNMAIAAISTMDIQPDEYKLIIIDALYRTLPGGTSENDNAAMMAVYNWIDSMAGYTNAAIVVIHHSSKGDQSGKGLTDIGAGAGAIARAADTHLAIRPHEEAGHCVMEAVTRSFKSPDPVSIKFEYPVWTATTLTPEIRKPGRVDREKQSQEDIKAKQTILEVIPEKGIKQAELIRITGFGCNRIGRLIQQLKADGLVIERRKRKKGGKRSYLVFFKVIPEVIPEVIPD